MENLMGLVLEEEDQVMHLIDLFSVFHILPAPGWKNLLTKGKDEIAKIFVLRQFNTFLWVLEAHLNFIENRTAHGEDEGLSLPDGWRL